MAILNVWLRNGPDHLKSEPKMADHSKAEPFKKSIDYRPFKIQTPSDFDPPLYLDPHFKLKNVKNKQ